MLVEELVMMMDGRICIPRLAADGAFATTHVGRVACFSSPNPGVKSGVHHNRCNTQERARLLRIQLLSIHSAL